MPGPQLCRKYSVKARLRAKHASPLLVYKKGDFL